MLKQLRPISVLALLFVVSLFSITGDHHSLELFAPGNGPAAKRVETDLGVVRSRPVALNLSLFNADHSVHGDMTQPGSVLELNLFNDVFLTGILEKMVTNNDGSISWVGYLAEYDFGSVVITVMPDGVVTGNIVAPDAFYQIRYEGNGNHSVRLVDQSAFPPDAEPIEVQITDQMVNAVEKAATRDSGSVIDVMVVWTPAARSAQGGTSAIQSLINTAVAETNQSYNNSNVSFQLNLVHMYEVSYTETGNFSTELSRLAGKTDGYMDDVHTQRDNYCADNVALIVNSTQYCGIAYIMTTVSSAFESNAFSVTARTCATGYYSFGHELGHNMGARHDWYVDGNTSPYIYNHGFVNGPDRWRTIMAYNSQCSASGYNCTRIQYWSNPGVIYGGDPMGVGGSSVGSSANNALALSNSASTVANFRDSSVSCSGGGNVAPTASFTYNTNNLSVSFDGTGSSDSDGTITNYAWNFGDGNSGSGSTANHTYASAGTYTVTLTVTDNDGATDDDVQSVTVTSGGGGDWTALSNSDFESGWQGWSDGGSDCRRSSNDSSYASQGTYCIRLRDNTSSSVMTRSENLSGYSEARVSFSFYIRSFENNEDFWLQVNDGSGWSTVATYVRNSSNYSNNNFYSDTVTINSGSFSFGSNVQFRFRADASGNSDWVYIDEVVIEAR